MGHAILLKIPVTIQQLCSEYCINEVNLHSTKFYDLKKGRRRRPGDFHLLFSEDA